MVSLFKTKSKDAKAVAKSEDAKPKPLEAHKIVEISTVDEFEQILEDHYERRVVVFCVTSGHKDPDVDEEGWYYHYERLNGVHFVKVDLDESPEMEERLNPKVKPCWVTFHKGRESGWSSGGMKRFVQVHSERRHSV